MKKNIKYVVITLFIFYFSACVESVPEEREIINVESDDGIKVEDSSENISLTSYKINIENNLSYKGEVSAEKRYLSIGFDDFRNSDFSMIIPLLKKYGGVATFNRIARMYSLTEDDINRIKMVLNNGNEMGDHTWFHCNYIFTDALCNGQNPICIEGVQTPFPSNEQLRTDCGNGKNAFGYSLNASVRDADFPYSNYIGFSYKSWKDLTDDECQKMREYFSIYADKSGKLELLDSLSNKYLGTVGKSYGSFDESLGIYTRGVFSGSKTSCNYEIWERIIEITKSYYNDVLGSNFDLLTWSWPGDWCSPFRFENNGYYYYDEDCTKLFNYLAKFESSITGDIRSYTDVLYGGGV